jgi:hypothetical protein
MAKAEIRSNGRLQGDQLAKAGILVGYAFIGLFALAIAVGIIIRIAANHSS